MVLQYIGDKSVARIKSCVPFSIRTIYRWISRFLLGVMESLRDRRRTGRPRQGTDRHLAWIRIVVGDQDPAQCQFECAWWTAQRVRQAWEEKFGSVLSGSPVRRSLRRLGLIPQRPQRRATRYDPAAGQRWKDQEFPQILRRAQELGALIACAAESGLAEQSVSGRTGGPCGQTPVGRVASGRFRLPWLAAISSEGQLLGHRAGRPCHGGGLPGVPQADHGGSGSEGSAGGGPWQDAPRPDHPGVAGSEPSRGRAVLSADLLAASQSGGTARGLGPAAGPSRAEQDRSTAARQPGSCLPGFARSSGTSASPLLRGRLQVYSCLNSDDTTFAPISTRDRSRVPQRACTDLRGGCRATGIPTAMGLRAASAYSCGALVSSCRQRGGDASGSVTDPRQKAPLLRLAAARGLREDEGGAPGRGGPGAGRSRGRTGRPGGRRSRSAGCSGATGTGSSGCWCQCPR